MVRNIVEYPITKKEILDCLHRKVDESNKEIKEKMIMGDMTPGILMKVIEIIEKSEDIK